MSVHLGWQCDNVRASYDEIPKATQDEVFAGARTFVKENKGRYECGGYIYSGEGQELGQFWAKLNVGNAKLQKTSSNNSITDRTLRWVQRQVAPTLKMLKKIDKGNGTDYMETIEQQAKLTEKHEMIIKQQTTPAKDLVES